MLANYTRSKELTGKAVFDDAWKQYQEQYDNCKNYLKQACEGRRIRSFKTIRMTLEQIYELLKDDPSIRIIYQTREPKAMLSSRLRMSHKYQNNSVTKFTLEMCVRIRNDVHHLSRILSEFPNNMFVTNYEALNKDVQATTEKVYDFLGLKMTHSVKKWLRSETVRRERGDQANTTDKWRSVLSEQQVKIVNDLCGVLP